MPIYKSKGGYKVKNVAGTSKTLGAARKRLKAVKAKKKKR